MIEREIIRNFEEVFSRCPKGAYGLIKKAIKRYSRTKRGRARLNMFLDCQGFLVEEDRIHKRAEYGEAMYDGYFEIFSCQHIAEEFVPLSVMFIEIDSNRVKIRISSQWRHFHKESGIADM